MADYLRYVIKAIEPIRIADDSVSQSGQTDTLLYIPGSTVRGAVVNNIARSVNLDAEENIQTVRNPLFSADTVFMNAYLTTKEHTLIPSPKGFYEDKTGQNGPKQLPLNVVISGHPTEGLKRASLGKYCYIENGCIFYYSPTTGSDLKIKIGAIGRDEQSVFRNEYMSAGQCFEGYIRLNGSANDSSILEQFAKGKTVILGNGRSAGLGKCLVILSERTQQIPYQEAGFEAVDECYMMLLSNTVMRDENGEYCGLNLKKLEQRLGVSDLQIAYCSTSVKEVQGYNRNWKMKRPAVLMYEAGSVFHFTFSGTISADKIKEIADSGIGCRRNEGCGRVLFLKDYEKVHEKLACDYDSSKAIAQKPEAGLKLSDDDRETLRIVAKGYYKKLLDSGLERYVVEHSLQKGGVKNSQLGTVNSILTKFRYNPAKAKKSLENFFAHVEEKENRQNIQKERTSVRTLKEQIFEIWEADLNDLLLESGTLQEAGKVMGISVETLLEETEAERYKLLLLIRMLRFDIKEGA